MTKFSEIMRRLAQALAEAFMGLLGFGRKVLGFTAATAVGAVTEASRGADGTHALAEQVEGATEDARREIDRHARFDAMAMAEILAAESVPDYLRVPDTGALPTPRTRPVERLLPRAVDPDADPERWLVHEALKHTTNVMFGTAEPVDLSVFGPRLRRRLERLTPLSAAPLHRQAIDLMGYDTIERGWWWPHLTPDPAILDRLDAEWERGHSMTIH